MRLFVADNLTLNASVILAEAPHHYLAHVMRGAVGDEVLLFNGQDGEWSALIESISKKETLLRVAHQTRQQVEEKLSDTWLCFAPIKKDNMDFVIQKATELGVSILQPVVTHRTVVGRVNTEKMRLQAIEAAEQSERLSVPQINDPVTLDKLLANWDKKRVLYYLDERREGNGLKVAAKVAFLVGPEGGFDADEIKKLQAFDVAQPLHLGRRILRAETASIAILSVYNHLTDWK